MHQELRLPDCLSNLIGIKKIIKKMKELIKDKKLIEEENDLKKSNNASTLCHQLSERDHV